MERAKGLAMLGGSDDDVELLFQNEYESAMHPRAKEVTRVLHRMKPDAKPKTRRDIEIQARHKPFHSASHTPRDPALIQCATRALTLHPQPRWKKIGAYSTRGSRSFAIGARCVPCRAANSRPWSLVCSTLIASCRRPYFSMLRLDEGLALALARRLTIDEKQVNLIQTRVKLAAKNKEANTNHHKLKE